ncbi:MAG: hypothetical protein F6K56_30125 [Moorea sp. SIO3G5]|nr:hypothetical protein [Moorena sp. SIO3G5]
MAYGHSRPYAIGLWPRYANALISNALGNTNSSYHSYEVHKIFSLFR